MANIQQTQFKNAQVLVNVDDLTGIFREIVREELLSAKEQELEDRLLSPDETCKLFKPAISLPTLQSYFKKGLIRKHYIGGRTWYKYSELMEDIKHIKRYQS